jgi:hypothetical protein
MHLSNLFLLVAIKGGSFVKAINSLETSSMMSSTVTARATPGEADCNSAASIVQACEASTPNFENLCFHDAQSCLCSTSGTWAPNFFDGYWSSCLAWAMVSDTSFYAVLGPHTNGVVESQKCHTWASFTATGGTPSGCSTSAVPTRSSVSLASARPTSIVSAGAAVQLGNRGLGAPLVLVIVNVVNVYVLA